MRTILIDTNIVSILFLPRHALYQKCIEEIGDRYCYIAFMTRAELLLWPKVNRWGRRAAFEAFSAHYNVHNALSR